jgi:hypothetical protein
MVLILTELGGGGRGRFSSFTSQQETRALISSILDKEAVFDSYGRTRLDVASPSELESYFRLALMPNLFNEIFKRTLLTPYLPAYTTIKMKSNETLHFINCGCNLILGLTVSWTPANIMEEPRTVFISGSATYAESLAEVDKMSARGWFSDAPGIVGAFSVKIETYNVNLKSGGVY